MADRKTATASQRADLRHAIAHAIALAEALDLPLVAIWLEHARLEAGPKDDRVCEAGSSG